MKTKNTLILLIVAAGLLGVIYYMNQKEETMLSSAAIPEQTLPGVTSGTVEKIEINQPGEKPVTLTRLDDKWYTNTEKKYEADQATITGVLNTLDKEIEAQVVSSSKDSFADYGVDETSGVKVRIYEKGKAQPTLSLYIGNDGPSAFTTYVREDGKDDVLNAQASLGMTFKRPDGWRNKQIFSFNGSNATRIEAAGTSQTFALAKQGDDQWLMESPEKAEAEPARVNSMANMLSSLRANDFIDPTAEQTLSDFGLEPPRQSITLNYEDKATSPSKSESVTLLIGKESNTPGDWYAKRKDKNDIFTIGQHVATALLPEPSTILVPKPEPPPPPAEEATTATESVTPPPAAPAATESTTQTEATLETPQADTEPDDATTSPSAN